MLLVKTIPNGKLATNTYLVCCDESMDAIIIDPADDPSKIIREINHLGFHISKIVNTHGHADHIAGNMELKEKYKCDIAVSKSDNYRLNDDSTVFAQYIGITKDYPTGDILLNDGDEIKVGDYVFSVIETPGHTEGGICLYCKEENLLFSGDTLFRRGYGRVDLPGGDIDKLFSSLNKLMKLPEETVVYSGHGRSTDIRTEREGNMFCQANGVN